jgi:ElaB/YqjD/DUF883 family membrane-anchored ribosome-binding protein
MTLPGLSRGRPADSFADRLINGSFDSVDQLVSCVEERPVAAVLVAFAAGFFTGCLLPRWRARQESERRRQA